MNHPKKYSQEQSYLVPTLKSSSPTQNLGPLTRSQQERTVFKFLLYMAECPHRTCGDLGAIAAEHALPGLDSQHLGGLERRIVSLKSIWTPKKPVCDSDLLARRC